MKDKNKIVALIDLLDDPDNNVYKVVEKELLKENNRIIPALEEKWESSLDEVCQQRIEELIHLLHFKETKKEMKKWAKSERPFLFHGFNIVNKFQYPDLNIDKTERIIDKIRKDVWLELNNSLTSLEKVSVLNHVFFNLHGFSINHSNPMSPQNCFLNQILDTRKANPVSIAILYAIIARPLELPIYFIDFPKNPLLAYFDHDVAIKAHGENVDSDILFYINPSNKGSITGRKELEYHLKKMKYPIERKYFEKGDDREFIMKLVSSLQEAYESMGYQKKVEEIAQLRTVIANYLE